MDWLPSKHVHLNETLLGLGAVVLTELQEPKTVDTLWETFKELKRRKKIIPEKTALEDLVLAMDCLFALGSIQMNEKGEFVRCA